jgi:hypothetical protein
MLASELAKQALNEAGLIDIRSGMVADEDLMAIAMSRLVTVGNSINGDPALSFGYLNIEFSTPALDYEVGRQAVETVPVLGTSSEQAVRTDKNFLIQVGEGTFAGAGFLPLRLPKCFDAQKEFHACDHAELETDRRLGRDKGYRYSYRLEGESLGIISLSHMPSAPFTAVFDKLLPIPTAEGEDLDIPPNAQEYYKLRVALALAGNNTIGVQQMEGIQLRLESARLGLVRTNAKNKVSPKLCPHRSLSRFCFT